MSDAIRTLAHDHADINRRVRTLATALRAPGSEATPATSQIEAMLIELRELLFLHFAREEEGLFPFLAELAPDLASRTQAMAIAHDQICGALARMVQLAATRTALSLLVSIFDRFEAAYAEHAHAEASLLDALDTRLDTDQRAQLASLIEGL